MNDLAEKLDRALTSLQTQNALDSFGSDTELKGLLEVASLAAGMPKAVVPKAAKQRKYVLAPAKQPWFSWTKLFTIGIVPLGLLLITTATVKLASSSRPGDALFSIKKFTEQVPYYLTQDPSKRATIQLALTQKRIDEVQSILSSEPSAQAQAAALTELSSQTQQAVDTVQKATNGSASNTSPLVASLEQLGQKQQTLLTNIPKNDSDNKLTDAAKAQLQKVLATVNDLSSANLPTNPVTVTITGVVISFDKGVLTVDKNTIAVDSHTVVKKDGGVVELLDLMPKLQVNVTATKLKDTLTATEIIIESKAPSADKPATTPDSQTSAPDASTDLSTDTNSNITKATFIPEDPAPQFIPGPGTSQ